MAESIDEITIQYEDEEGRFMVKELDKKILTKGAWTTIIFLYQEMNKKSGEYGEPKASIRRYKKSGNFFRQQSKFNISNKKQALQIADILNEWFKQAN